MHGRSKKSTSNGHTDSVPGWPIALAIGMALWVGACAEPPSAPVPEADPPGAWTQFRGAGGLGVVENVPLPQHWTEEEGIRWSVPLPDGVGQPTAFGDRVFVTAGRDSETPPRRVLIAIDLERGSVLWESEILTAAAEKMHEVSSLAQTTPAVDREAVYTYFGSVLAATSHDGQLLWKETIDPLYPEQSRYGAVSSPVLTDDTILVFRDVEYGDAEHKELGWTSWLAAFSKQDGTQLWKTEWTGTCCSYATPTLLERDDGSRQVVITTSPKILGFDAETGTELWSVPYPTVQVVPSSLVDGDLLIASGAMHQRLSAGFEIIGAGAETKVRELWRIGKQVPKMASPVLYGGRLFQISEGGVVSVIRAVEGKPWKRWRNPPGPYHASLVAGDGKIFALSARGTVTVWRSEPPFEVLGSYPLPGGTGPYEAMSATDGVLLARARRALYCVEGFEPAEPEAADPADAAAPDQ